MGFRGWLIASGLAVLAGVPAGVLAGSAFAEGETPTQYCGSMQLLLKERGGAATPEDAVAALSLGEDDSTLTVDTGNLRVTAADGTLYALERDLDGNWRVQEVMFTCAEVNGA